MNCTFSHLKFSNICLILLLSFVLSHYGKSMPMVKSGSLAVDGCSPLSTLPCSVLKVTLPFSLGFEASVANTILDANGVGTGFTTVNTYSGTRLAADGPPSNSQVPGYEPSKITVSGGRLWLIANKGIDYTKNNNQLNVLGVKTGAVKKLQFQARIVLPYNGTESQQAGLWYGLNDKTFVKLSVNGNRIELRREKNDVTSTPANGNIDQRITPVINSLNTKSFMLRMVIDSIAGTAEAFYSIDGITYINVGATYATHGLPISDMGITGGVSNAGLFASYRNGSTPITYRFDDLTISDITVPTQFQAVKINFRPQGSAPPAGYVADNGLAFDATRKFGWINPVTKVPVSLAAATRLRSGSADPKQLSLISMQATTSGQVPGTWEYALPNGLYRVTISAGDYSYYDSNHQINIEGLPAISDFIAKAQNPFRTATATVQVNDGKLTVDALKGVNGKINYIDISPASAVTDGTAPTAGARFVGTLQSANNYKNQVQIFLTASDAGGSGLAKFQYSMNNGVYTTYTGPIIINTPGSYSLNIKAIDGNNNQTITNPYNFSVVDTSVPKTLSFSTDKLNFTVLRGKQVQSQSVNLTSSPATPSCNLSKTEAEWLTLPGTSNPVQFGPQNINSNIEPGFYQSLVTATADGYEPATLLISLLVVDAVNAETINVNFQDPATVPPIGYIRDYGQPFGSRTGSYQSAGLTYGWKKRSDATLLDLTLNGRFRDTPEDVLQATFIHMQANHITSSFSGVKTEGYWEMKVPNGSYDVTVSVGDGTVNSAPEFYSINVEGTYAIKQFVPIGSKGSQGRFKSALVRVNVADELLTINADGGTNTKIDFANIVPVSLSPYLFWASKNSNIIIKKGSTETNAFSVILGSSDNSVSTYNLSATYGAGATGWLSFNATPAGAQPNVTFNYNAAKNLAVGVYKATIKANSGSLTSAELSVQLNVVDGAKPYVISSNPYNGETKVGLGIVSVAANNLHIPEIAGLPGGVNNSTIDSNSVRLFKMVDNASIKVRGVVQGTGGGDVISFSPSAGLEANAVYKFMVTSAVKSQAGAEFAPYEATFTTAAGKVDSSNFLNARFGTKVPIPGTQNKKYTTLTIGPDGKFYALRLDGNIERFTINHTTGMLSEQTIINTINAKYGNRSAIGLVFAPQSTASNLIAYVSHSSSGLSAAPEFDGNLSRLDGNNLINETLVITKLPRSRRDHLVNSLAFGPDGALYMNVGSMSSAGSKDPDWQRDENLLAGAVLRLDMTKLASFVLPLNVQTTFDQSLINNAPAVSATMGDGTYNPYGSASPLTIYASGVRNAYDLLWHSNGQLYLPTNGSGGGGFSPASVAGTRRPNGTFYNGPEVLATSPIKPQHDWLFRVNPNKPTGFFGHPNPLRGEYVLNRGYKDDTLYLPSVVADANYRPGYDFGLNNSPNGVIEYKSNTFNGVLKGKLLVCRFSGGGDIAVMEPTSMTKTSNPSDDAIYDIKRVTTGSGNNGLVGMSGFGNPLDIVEDVVNGNLYIIEYNWNDSPNLITQISLLPVPGASPAPALLAVTARSEPAATESQNKKYEIVISNTGGDSLKVKNIRLAGTDARKFNISNVVLPTERSPLKLAKDGSISFNVYASSLLNASSHAKLVITTTDNTVKEVEINNVSQTELAEIDNTMSKDEDHVMEVFPNPNLGNPVFVKLKKFVKREPVTIYLYDMRGNVLKSESAVADENGELTRQIVEKNNNSFIIKVMYISGSKVAKVVNIN